MQQMIKNIILSFQSLCVSILATFSLSFFVPVGSVDQLQYGLNSVYTCSTHWKEIFGIQRREEHIPVAIAVELGLGV